MVSPTSLLPLAYVCGGLVPLVLVPHTLRHWEKPGSTGLLVALGGLTIWSIAYGLAVTTSAYGQVLVLGSIVILGSQLAAVGYLFVALEYTDAVELGRVLVGGFTAFVLLVFVVSVTDPAHGLLWGETDRPVVDTTASQPLATGTILFTMAIGAVAVLVLVVDTVTATGAQRTQSLALVGAGLPTLAISVADVYVIDAYVHSLLPFGVLTSVVALWWALFRADFLEVVPIGRKRIVEEMDDAAVVIDCDGRVVECNPAARTLTGVADTDAGTPAEEFFAEFTDAVDQLTDQQSVETEISIDCDGNRRTFHRKTSPLEESRTDRSAGRLIVLREITELKRRERELERRESELEFLQQLLSRVLRHNVRNDLSVVRGYASMIEDETDGTVADRAATIVDKSDGLLETSKKAWAMQRIVESDCEAEPLDLAQTVRSLVDEYRSAHARARIAFDVPDRCLVVVDPQLERAIDALLENALIHHDGTSPTVAVRLEAVDGRVVVTIEDDGPGIPDDELAVLDRGEETPLHHTSGVGLWMAHWIVERSAASIDFESDPGGTTVSITVPADRTHWTDRNGQNVDARHVDSAGVPDPRFV
ncbi:histidine kinase N-terminal 7TM domain-containing protein [Natrarchaeobaculum aegyptiacum]|uniref:histidine kinase n=1 Tax=Natrarchaeobaculum aegyptiacum TaxID=745377 RepID=A0A2Z2HVZ4_9EURY|nr:histidine kinase N-terminal 7TM domain-containing protein [Natrarchaeobaculum aegyptiacum]ARS91392.1 hypothetical protein B1756_17815 [Natrarchaeobaculum aegyptiacum]